MGFGGMRPRMAGSPYERPEDRRRRAGTPAEALPVLPWQSTGPDGGRGQAGNSHPTDLRSFDSIGDYFNDPDVRANGRALMDMLMVGSPTMVGAKMAAPGVFGALPGTEAGGAMGGGGVSAAELGASLAEGNTTGMFEHGGVVRREDLRGPNPPGRDEGYVAVHPGEVILNRRQQAMLAKALLGR